MDLGTPTVRLLNVAARCSAVLLLVLGARAGARPGMGGGYVEGGSRSNSTPSSARTNGTSPGSTRTGNSPSGGGSTGDGSAPHAQRATGQPLDEAHPDFRRGGKPTEVTFRLREDGRVETVESYAGLTCVPGKGMGWEASVAAPPGWLPSSDGPLRNGLLSGNFTVTAGGQQAAEAQLVPVTDMRSDSARSRMLARIGLHQLPGGPLEARTALTFSPARAGRELSWGWALPPVPCEAWKDVRLQLTWPPGFVAPEVEALGVERVQYDSSMDALTVRETAEGHEVSLPGCGSRAQFVVFKATLTPAGLAALPKRPLPTTVLSHVLQVHADGRVRVESRGTLEPPLAQPLLRLGGRGQLAPSGIFHPVDQLYRPLPWDIWRGEDAGSPALSYRAFGHVGAATDEPSRARISFQPPWLTSAVEREGRERDVLHDVLVRFDEPSWLEDATVSLAPDCLVSEWACIDSKGFVPRTALEVERAPPGELRARFVDGASQRPWTLQLELSRGDPTHRLPRYPLALAAHVATARGDDEVTGAGEVLAKWVGVVFAPPLIGGLLLFALGWRQRARESTARTASGERTRAETRLRRSDSSFEWADFESRVGRATSLLMRAWSDGTLEQARHVLSSGVYQRFRIQCRLLRDLDGVRNVVQDFELQSAQPAHVGEDGAWQVIHVRLRARLRDVTLPAGTDAASADRALSAAPHQAFEEVHTWVRRLGVSTVAERNPVERRECRGCGAPADFSHASVRCGHCGAVFNAGEADWVLSEMTQVSEWSGPREAAAVVLPDGLARGVLEDKASALFWRALEAGARGVERIRPFAAVQPGAPLGELLGPAAGRHSEAVVGAVTLLAVRGGGGGLRADFEVRWSSKNLSLGEEKPVHRKSVVTLEFSAEDRDTATGNYADPSDCAACGAPAPELYAPTCEHCGGALPVRVRDWRLMRIG